MTTKTNDLLTEIVQEVFYGRLERVLSKTISEELGDIFNPCESVVACPEHGGANGDKGRVDQPGRPDCSGCHHATVTENLSRAMMARHLVVMRIKLGLDSPEAWRKAAADLHLWDGLLDAWPECGVEVGHAQ